MNIFEKLKAGVTTSSAEETIALAAALAVSLPEEAVLALEGDLGSGKTTFVKGLGRAWGIAEPITSPTFTICQLYAGSRQLAHMDAYRLEDATDLWDELMLEELLVPPFCLAIEWPGNLASIPWIVTHRIRFQAEGEERRIQLS